METMTNETVEINKTEFILKNYEKLEKFYFWQTKEKDLKGTLSVEEYKTKVLLDLCLLWESNFDFRKFQEEKQRDKIKLTLQALDEYSEAIQKNGNIKYITIEELKKIEYKLRLNYTQMMQDSIEVAQKKEYSNISTEYQNEDGESVELDGLQTDFDYESINNQSLIRLIRVATSDENYKFLIGYVGGDIEKSATNRVKYHNLLKQMQEKLKGLK